VKRQEIQWKVWSLPPDGLSIVQITSISEGGLPMNPGSTTGRTTLLVLACVTIGLTADKAERTWQAKCAICHGDDGRGQTKKGLEMQVKDFTTPAFQSGTTKDQLKTAIEIGVNRFVPAAPAKDAMNGKKVTASVVKPPAQVKQQMDGYRDKLKPEQVDDLVIYIWSLKK
jgi:hypothetical protein